jgi:hypothetical protein
MTHSPPIPAANQAPYPPVESLTSPKAEKTDLVARMKHNSEAPAVTGFRPQVAPLIGAALVGAIGYAGWAGRTRSANQK